MRATVTHVAVCLACLMAGPSGARAGWLGMGEQPATKSNGVSLKLPVEVKGDVSDFVPIKAETSGKEVRWVVIDPGLKLFPVELLRDSRTAVVVAARSGRYRLLAYTAKGDLPSEPAICLVVIGSAPNPDPDPGPLPDPTDPLTKALQAAYATETDPQKGQHRQALAALYRQSALVVAKPEIQTAGQLFDVMAEAAASLGVQGKLPAVQKVIQTELLGYLPTKRDAPLDEAARRAARAVFTKISAALEVVR